jgi:rhodanese-related sulfurtransferase
MTAKLITPEAAARLCARGGAVLVDVREPDEHARQKIDGAMSLPLSSQDEIRLEAGTIIFHCKSGARTGTQTRQLGQKAGNCEWFVLEGGLDGWRRAGLPVVKDARQPLELQRQVQLAAGAIVALGTLAGLLLSPWFFAAPLFVGSGLIFAGASGFCGLARLLVRAPWNRRAQPEAA